MKCILIIIALLISGCGFKGEISFDDGKENAWVEVTDTRDGEVFYYNNNTITNPMRGVGTASSINIVTSEGKKMTITTDMMTYLKWREVDKPPQSNN